MSQDSQSSQSGSFIDALGPALTQETARAYPALRTADELARTYLLQHGCLPDEDDALNRLIERLATDTDGENISAAALRLARAREVLDPSDAPAARACPDVQGAAADRWQPHVMAAYLIGLCVGFRVRGLTAPEGPQ
jgi:hypothetical protein